MNETTSPSLDRKSLASLVGTLAAYLASETGKGDAAALRRADPNGLPPLAFWRLYSRWIGGEANRSEHNESRWLCVMHLMAHAVSLHQPKPSLGAALSSCEVAESRVSALLRAQSNALVSRARGCVQILNARGQRFNQVDLARLVLSTHTSEAGDSIRRRIARDYFSG